MTDDALFGLANAIPLLGWLALALAPLRRRLAIGLARSVAAVLAAGYLLLVGLALARAPGPMPDLTSLTGLARAFADPHVMLIGWVHYLAFDLWVGSWEAEEAHRVGMPHLLLLPCLAFTFLAGPIGLLMFLGLRYARGLAQQRPNHDMR